MFEATQPLMKKFLIMEAVQYLRPQWTKYGQNFTIWEGFEYILTMIFEATQPLMKKFLNMEAVQYLRPQLTN